MNLTFEICRKDIHSFNIHLVESSIIWRQAIDSEDEASADLTQIVFLTCVSSKFNQFTILYHQQYSIFN